MHKTTVSVLSIVALAFISLASASRLRADTIFTNLGPGDSYQTNHQWNVGTGSGENQAVAFSFVPTETATLTDVSLGLYQISGTSPTNVYIESNLSGEPGSILDTLTQVGSVTPTSSLVDFTCSSCSQLQAGTTYWIVGQQSDSSSLAGWNLSNSDIGTWYYNFAGSATGPWTATDNPISAFEVDGTSPVPEPSTVVLLGTGILGLAGTVRRKFFLE